MRVCNLLIDKRMQVRNNLKNMVLNNITFVRVNYDLKS